ncbi:hypothetical protein NKH18_21410 [Streptomyces sp. M10(2022)]
MAWFGRRDDGFHPAAGPLQKERCRGEQAFRVEREEEAVACGAGAAAGTPQTLEERGDGRRRVELDDAVQVPDVDAQFQRAGGNDHAVA